MTYDQGQLDMLAWLSGTDPDDDPMAPACIPVRSHAWVWCLAHNLYSAACAVWKPGCGRGAP